MCRVSLLNIFIFSFPRLIKKKKELQEINTKLGFAASRKYLQNKFNRFSNRRLFKSRGTEVFYGYCRKAYLIPGWNNIEPNKKAFTHRSRALFQLILGPFRYQRSFLTEVCGPGKVNDSTRVPCCVNPARIFERVMIFADTPRRMREALSWWSALKAHGIEEFFE